MIPNYDSFALVIVDMQEKLLSAMQPEIAEKLLKNTEILIEMAKEFGGSIYYTEQYPKGLGQTHPRLKALLKDALRVEKISFSCMQEPDFCEALTKDNPECIIMAGIESHICVLMTAIDMMAEEDPEDPEAPKYGVFVPVDAIASRSKLNWKNAIDQMRDLGVIMTNTETLVYEALGEGTGDVFKRFSKMMK